MKRTFLLWRNRTLACWDYRCSWIFIVGVVVGLSGCSQEPSVEKAKAAAASGNAAAQAAVDAIQTPMDQARQVESVIEKSAEQRAAQSKETTQ